MTSLETLNIVLVYIFNCLLFLPRADVWTNIAVSYDSDKEVAIIYVDGDIKEGANGAGALSVDWDGEASFGKHNSSADAFDWLDEVYMFDRELTALEIRTLFMKCSYVLNQGEIAKRWPKYPIDSFAPLHEFLRNRSIME